MAVDLRRFEQRLAQQGFTRIAGVDEAGRGAWAGPMIAAAVVLPADFDCEDLDDSKKLTKAKREACYERVVADAVCWTVVKATPARIDRKGLHRSNKAILREAVTTMAPPPDYVLCDGWPLERLAIPHLSIKKGDAVTASVAAASIVAKVERDRIMERYAKRYPEFGFEQNKGYGTPEHRAALEQLGPTQIHRLSFSGVGQTELFSSVGPLRA